VLGPIRATTVIAALTVFGAISIRRRNPMLALVTVLAWASAFEIVYDAVGVIAFAWAFSPFVWQTAALLGWVILAALVGVRPDWLIGIVFLVLMAAWAFTGFRFNLPGTTTFDARAEFLNEAAKSTLALAYLVGALRVGDGSARRVRTTVTPSELPVTSTGQRHDQLQGDPTAQLEGEP
jgi:hypothetical protein